LGKVLLDKKLISDAELQDGLIYQMREIVLNIFPFFKGEFRFQGKEDLSEEYSEAKINIPMIIEDGIRHMKFDPSLKEFLSGNTISSGEETFSYCLNKEEKELLEAVKDSITPEELLKLAPFEPEIFWKSLYLFYCLDMISLSSVTKSQKKQEKEKDFDAQTMDDGLKSVLDFHERIESLNFYQILDISRSSPSNEVKKSYFKKARKYHPDLFDRNLLTEVREKIADVFDKITKAYHTLSDETKRKEYDQKLESSEGDTKRDISKGAEVKFRQGKTLYDQGRFDEAMIYLEQAVRMDETKASYFLLLGMAQSKMPAYTRKAEANFLKAIQLSPWNADAYVTLGLLYKREGLMVKAKKQFRKALSIDPGHRAALKELKLEGKSEKKKGLKDFLSMDLFGSKGKKSK
jgi:curved DNA-binding protein CbpA